MITGRHVARLLLAAAVLTSAGVAAAAESEAAYRQRLAAALRAARAGEAAPRGEPRQSLRRIEQLLPARLEIEGRDGTRMMVDHAAVREAARAEAAHPAMLRRRLEALAAAAAPIELPDDAAARREVIRRVLARPEFQPDWLERLEEEVIAVLLRLLSRLPGQAPTEFLRSAAYLIFWVAVTLVVLLLGWILYLVLRRQLTNAGPPRVPSSGVVQRPPQPETCLAQAEEAARRGEYRTALRLTYLAILLHLDRAALVTYDAARTNGEILRHLREPAQAPVRRLLLPVTRKVDERLYGGMEVAPQDYEECRAACGQLEGLLCSG